MFDWGGEFNSFIVPFSPFGDPTVNREFSAERPRPDHRDELRRRAGRPARGDSAAHTPFDETALVTAAVTASSGTTSTAARATRSPATSAASSATTPARATSRAPATSTRRSTSRSSSGRPTAAVQGHVGRGRHARDRAAGRDGHLVDVRGHERLAERRHRRPTQASSSRRFATTTARRRTRTTTSTRST